MPASFLSFWVYSSVCSESTNQADWIWELSSLRKKPLENVFGHFCSYLIMPCSSGFPFETYFACGVQCSCPYFHGCVWGGGRSTLFLSRPVFHFQSRGWCLCPVPQRVRVALGVAVPCGRTGPTSCPGRCPPPPVLKPLRRGWIAPVPPCLVLPVCPWAGSHVCAQGCVYLFACAGRRW